MKRIFSALLFLACSAANAQFITGQILTAAQLNAAFANVLSNSGGTLTGPLSVQGNTTVTNLTVNGTFSVPGGFSPSSLSPQAANTDLANVTGASASPVAVAIPSCSATNSAIKYTSGAGWGCGTTFSLTSDTLAQFAATTSAQLAGVISDETGTGSAVFGTSPTIATPAITGGTISGAPISGSTGSFTTLAASSTVSGAGFTTLLSPYLTTATAASTYATIAQATTALAATGGSISGVSVAATTLSASANDALFYQTTNAQSFTSGTAATVTTWTKVFDRVNANFNASTGIFTAPVTGIYHVAVQLGFSANTGAIATVGQVFISANGVVVAVGNFMRQTATSTAMFCSAVADVSLTAGQIIIIQGSQNTGSAVTLNGNAQQNYLSIHRIP